jgi:putative ABC transport system permease protein
MLSTKLVIRDIVQSRHQALVFVLCVVMAIVSLVAVNGFSESVNTVLRADARALHAGDIIIHSHQPLSPGLLEAVAAIESDHRAEVARIYEFYSVVRTESADSLLANIKVVEKGYPFYGRCELASGRALSDVLSPGRIVVEPALLDRLGLRVGQVLKVGSAALTVADVLLSEPDRPVSVFSLGPRVMIAAGDLPALDLIGKGSRITYNVLLKVPVEADIPVLVEQLTASADSVSERVDTYRSARSGIKRFLDNFLFFLSLIGIFTLMLAGIGIHSALTAFLREKTKSIAIMKTLGATGRFVLWHYSRVLLLMGGVGTVIGILVGLAVQKVLPILFSGLIPAQVPFHFSWIGILEGFALGIGVVALFAHQPLYRLTRVKPAFLLRKEMGQPRRGPFYYLSGLAISGLFIGLVFWQLRVLTTSLYFIGGVVAFLAVTAAAVSLLLAGLQRLKVAPLVIRQALKGLFRPGNATRPVLITLTTALTVIFTIVLLEENLDRAFVQSYPPDTPNLFFLDIQPDQVEAFGRVLGASPRYHPVIRAKLLSINGVAIDRSRPRQRRRGDSLTRTFNLTYRSDLLDDEVLLEGARLFDPNSEDAQVSVLDTVLEMHPMRIGDRLTFRIQGVPLEARISSIRSRTRESISPYFYFVFPAKVLKTAPQTIFTAVHMEKSQIHGVQNKIADAFPNVSMVDMTATIAAFAGVTAKLSAIVGFFTSFSLAVGLMIVVGSVFATRLARTREAVYYKVLGARGGFVAGVFSLENFFIGLAAAFLALVLAQAAGWAITANMFDIAYRPSSLSALWMLAGSGLLTVAVGLAASRSILRQKPLIFLREQTQE